jgi:nitrogen-specific signal transduction histidine kinase
VSLAVQDVNAVDILDTVHQPLLLLSADRYVVTANPAFYAMFRLRPLETLHHLVYELGMVNGSRACASCSKVRSWLAR